MTEYSPCGNDDTGVSKPERPTANLGHYVGAYGHGSPRFEKHPHDPVSHATSYNLLFFSAPAVFLRLPRPRLHRLSLIAAVPILGGATAVSRQSLKEAWFCGRRVMKSYGLVSDIRYLF
jgi:hypothetical protein